MRYTVLILLLILGSNGYSQQESRPGYLGQVGIVFHEVPIEGSPYFDDVYKPGNTTVNGKEVHLLMRHNAYSDQIELKDVKQKEFNLLRRNDLTAEFGGRKYLLMSYEDREGRKEGYFNPLNEGKAVLYFKPKKEFIQARQPDNGYDTYKPPVYRDISEYYLAVGKQELKVIRLAKGPVLKSLNSRSGKLKKFISENQLDLKSETGVVKLLNYYNSL